MTKEELLAEVEDLLRTMPFQQAIVQGTGESLAWLGRVSAVIENWSLPQTLPLSTYISRIHGGTLYDREAGIRELITLLHQARHDLRMQTPGLANVAISKGMVFDYFDEVRKIIELAKQDLLFVDPYLDTEFVSRYLPHTAAGVTVRLLARERLATLLPAVDAFAQQFGTRIEVRSAPNFHDRYIFVDRTACYQSGASFKDGAKSAPTTLTEIRDAFGPVLQTYEYLWKQANVER